MKKATDPTSQSAEETAFWARAEREHAAALPKPPPPSEPPSPTLPMKNNTFTFGKLMITTTRQASGAPFCDTAFSREEKGLKRRWKCLAFLLTPWRRNDYGETRPMRALVVGWQQS